MLVLHKLNSYKRWTSYVLNHLDHITWNRWFIGLGETRVLSLSLSARRKPFLPFASRGANWWEVYNSISQLGWKVYWTRKISQQRIVCSKQVPIFPYSAISEQCQRLGSKQAMWLVKRTPRDSLHQIILKIELRLSLPQYEDVNFPVCTVVQSLIARACVVQKGGVFT